MKAYSLCRIIAVTFCLALNFVHSHSYAQSAEQNPSIAIPHTVGEMVLDGKLDEEFWQGAKEIDLNIVNFPWDNTPSPIKTTAKIVENGSDLLIAFIAEDPNPENILSYYADRDTRWDDDLVGIKLDPQNNHRLNYEFVVNPLGMQMDSIQNHTTGEKNDLWDGIWQSYGQLTETGYLVEIKIPFRILNFSDEQAVKTWPFELFRIYPRDTWLRISHIKLDKDIACKTCQYPLATGFESVSSKENIMVTPAVVAKSEQSRDIYNSDDNWHEHNDVEIGADLRWGITSNTLINATINPDFSFIEADAAQLNVNQNFSLNYSEKRPFFLENSEYFSSNFDLIYTRNITDPDYGIKVTGANDNHTYGAFISHDSETNFILPGNLSSDIVNLAEESHASAYKYRFDVDQNLSLGLISTIRKSANYHNYTAGFDAKYQLNESNSILAQVVSSDTQYPTDLFAEFCTGDACLQKLKVACFSLACPYNEQVSRADKSARFSDQAVKVDFQHRSEYWDLDASHQKIGKNFRADLGFMPRADFAQDSIKINRKFFANEQALWQEGSASVNWDIKHNENGELIEKQFSSSAGIDGPLQSRYLVTYNKGTEVGLRYDQSITAIDNNTSRFDIESFEYFTAFKPINSIYLELKYSHGDEIDYVHNRLGEVKAAESYISWFATQHLELEVSYLNSQLTYQGNTVYDANLIDSRINYQFNARSQLKLSLIYCNIKRPAAHNPSGLFDQRKKEFSTQLIYSYKINPQTVFYLGYSDNSYQDDYLNDLTRENKTFFSKISYAWIP
ncbi:MAG: DUF5916 domain-containing protein [Thalassotalea sp.]